MTDSVSLANKILLMLNEKYDSFSTDNIITESNKNTSKNTVGGISIDEIEENLTGGSLEKSDKKPKDISVIVPKEINENLLEGGDVEEDTEDSESYEEESVEEEDVSSDNEEDAKPVSDMDIIYRDFVEKWKNKNIEESPKLAGGNKEESIEIITMFPYLIR